MIAVHLEKGRVEIRRRPWPRRRPGYALIRLRTAGICNTDLELQRGYYNFRGTPGHEFVGEVVEAGDQALLGRRVVGEINVPCGRCDWCGRGLGRHCPRRTTLGISGWPGVFSEYFTLPEANLHLVPDAVSDDQAVLTEPIAAACEILDQVRIPRHTPVAVLGDGKLGLLAALVLHAAKLDVRLYGKHKEKLAIAAANGVETALSSAKPPIATYDWVVEATGSSRGLDQAIAMTRPRGTVILKSTVHGQVAMDTAAVVVNEITLVGSRCGRFQPALDLLRKRKLNLDGMISAHLPLAEAPRAFRLAARKGVLKILLDSTS